MLTKSTLNAITLLFEQNDFYDNQRKDAHIDAHERSRLQAQLMQSGLLNEAGQLSKPLETISLFDLLNGLNETLHLSGENAKRPYVSHSLETLNTSFCLWLKSIKLNEL